MKVKAVFHGVLADWLGTGQAAFDLPDDAVYQDLLDEIGRRFGSAMPPGLWDPAARTFKIAVMAQRDGRLIKGDPVVLASGDVLDYYLVAAGG